MAQLTDVSATSVASSRAGVLALDSALPIVDQFSDLDERDRRAYTVELGDPVD